MTKQTVRTMNNSGHVISEQNIVYNLVSAFM